MIYSVNHVLNRGDRRDLIFHADAVRQIHAALDFKLQLADADSPQRQGRQSLQSAARVFPASLLRALSEPPVV
jgi:hypothetical protein